MDPYIDPEKLDAANPFYDRKINNLRRGNEEHAARAEVTTSLPVKITLQTTDACNLDCPHCQIPKATKKPRMDVRVFERVVEDLFPTLVELHPTNLGEPFAWPLFERLCAEMTRHGILLDLTTNGTLLSKERISWLVPIARDVKVSFDGATAAVFERLRRGASFDAVCANVRGLAAALASAPARPSIALQMTLMRSNFQELPALVRLAAELGAQRVNAYHLFSFSSEMDAESIVNEPAAWPPVLSEALAIGKQLGIELRCAEPSSAGQQAALAEIACHLPWHEAWVDFDGAVLPCHSHGGDVAGHLLETPFVDIWNGDLYRQIRRAFAQRRPGWHCTNCGMNWQKSEEHQIVPYDPESFLSRLGRGKSRSDAETPIRWSGRMKPFDLVGRRHGQ